MIRRNEIDVEVIKKETDELRAYVNAQIDKNWDKRMILSDGESKCIASFMTHADTRWGSKKVWSKTAATEIVNELKEAGFYVWFSSVVYDEESYWVTSRPECPHSWYHRI